MPLDPMSAALVVLGVVALGTAIVWRGASHQRRLAAITRNLSAPEADQRADAARQLVSMGLDRAAPFLVDFVRTEPDDTVLAAIALSVLQRQWEPSGSTAVQQVRWWAGTELERQGVEVEAFPPAFTRLSDMGGPRLPAPIKSPSPSESSESADSSESSESEVVS